MVIYQNEPEILCRALFLAIPCSGKVGVMTQKTAIYQGTTGNLSVLAMENCQKGLAMVNFGSPAAAITLDRHA